MRGPRVKGALILPLAMVIKDQKQLDWLGKTELTPEDLKKINEGILASVWYEREFYERVGNAVYKLVGNNRPEGAYLFGEGILAQTLFNIYRGPLAKKEPGEALKKYASLINGTLFENARAEYQPVAEGAILRIYDPEGIPHQESFAYGTKGFIVRLVKENQGDKVRVELEEEPLLNSQKLNTLTYHIYWEEK